MSGWVYDSVSGLVDEWAGDVVYMVTGVCTVCVCVCVCVFMWVCVRIHTFLLIDIVVMRTQTCVTISVI